MAPPSRTRTAYTPKFLRGSDETDLHDFYNEYVPPIVAAPIHSINGMESPKLWPENAEFVTGCRFKRNATSHRYNRETSAGRDVSSRPQSSASLEHWIERTRAEEGVIDDCARQESEGTMMSKPLTAISMCETKWRDQVMHTANSTLKATMARDIPPYIAHTLMDSTDSIRYSGSTAVIIHSQSTEELRFKMMLQQTASTLPYQLRWRHIITNFQTIKGKLKRDQNMTQAIVDIGTKLRIAAVMSGAPTMIRRADFIKTLSKTKYFENVPAKELSVLFSVYDPLKRNIVRFVEIIAALTSLNNPLATGTEKLGHIWKAYESFGSDLSPMEMCLAVLSTCCGSDHDQKTIDNLFKKQFKYVAYDLTMRGQTNDSAELLGFDSSAPSSGSPVSSPSPAAAASGSRPISPAAVNESFVGGGQGSPKQVVAVQESGVGKWRTSPQKKQSSSAVQSAFNICDGSLDYRMFCKVLSRCPELLAAFDEQLNLQLVHCYGKDARHEEAALPTDDQKDFSWIISRSKSRNDVRQK